jgi:hypothetical protein
MLWIMGRKSHNYLVYPIFLGFFFNNLTLLAQDFLVRGIYPTFVLISFIKS